MDKDNNDHEDDWDALCIDPHAEAQAEGHREGQAAGRAASLTEGYKLGQTTALNYGTPLGFVQGVVEALSLSMDVQEENGRDGTAENSIADKKPTSSPVPTEKARRTLQNLQRALDDFPQTATLFQNPETTDSANQPDDKLKNDDYDDSERRLDSEREQPTVRQAWQRIQTRFRLLMVQLHMPHISLEAVLQDSPPQLSSNIDSKPAPSTDW